MSLLLDAVFKIGLDPVFDVVVQLRPAINQSDARAVPPQIESRDGGGVLAPDYQHVRVIVGMSVAIVVRDLGQILARNAKLVGKIVIAGRDDYLASAVVVRTASAVRGRDAEVSVFAHDGLDPFVLANVEMVMFRHLAVILRGFFAGGLLAGRGETECRRFRGAREW